jgi:hypothetical protein
MKFLGSHTFQCSDEIRHFTIFITQEFREAQISLRALSVEETPMASILESEIWTGAHPLLLFRESGRDLNLLLQSGVEPYWLSILECFRVLELTPTKVSKTKN